MVGAPTAAAMASTSTEALEQLIDVVAQLRDPNDGCPWDLEQSHRSLVPYVLEEAHEVADAIRHGDDNHLKEELGDLLLQVLLHAQIGSEEQRFNLADVADAIRTKLIRRHPHVFGDDDAKDSASVRKSWEQIKAAEQASALENSNSPLSDRLAIKIRRLTRSGRRHVHFQAGSKSWIRMGELRWRLGQGERRARRTQRGRVQR